MRKRLVRAAVFIAIALGLAVGGANAAGAMEGIHFGGAAVATDGSTWI
jgi:hypothetical protein